VSPITPVTPVISHPGGPNSPIISHPISPVGRIGSGSAGGGNISPVTPVTPVISHPGGGIVGAGSPITPSSQGDPGGSGFLGGPVGIPSF
jgi:hypothetical protein